MGAPLLAESVVTQSSTGRSRCRAVALVLALLVPVAIDPWVGDHQLAKAVVLALAGAVALLGEALGGVRGARRPTWAETWLALFALWALASAAWAPNAPLAWARATVSIGMLGVLRAARASVPEGRTRVVVLGMLAVGAVGMIVDGALVLAGKASGDYDPSAAKFSSGLFVHNNLASSYATLLAPLAVAMLASARPGRRAVRVSGVIALVGLVAYLFVLNSRAGLLAAALGVGVAIGARLARPWLARRAAPSGALRAAAVAVVVVAALLPFSTSARGVAKDLFYDAVSVTGLDPGDVQRRPVLWAKGMRMVGDHPVLGVGAGNFAVMLPRYDRLIVKVPHAHNDALHVLTEMGPVGLALFAAWLVASAAQVGAALLRAARDGRGGALAAGATGMLVVFVVTGVFETPWRLGATAATVALLLGLVAGRLDEGRDPPRGLPMGLRVAWVLAALAALSSAVVRTTGLWWLADAEARAVAGDVEGAIATCRRLAALPLGSPVPHTMLADVAEGAGRLDEALEHRRAASDLWPYGATVLEDQGDTLFALGRHLEALESYERAMAASPGRSELRYKVAFALDRVGRRIDAIEVFEAEVQRQRAVDTAVVLELAKLWQREAEARLAAAEPPTPEALEATVAARHFYALVLQDGTTDLRAIAAAPFEYLTDILQRRPGSPDSWWPTIYEPWRQRHGWLHLPATSLYTSMTRDVRKLYPGWEEPHGPPRPAAMRNEP